jgi:hypothetical protein
MKIGDQGLHWPTVNFTVSVDPGGLWGAGDGQRICCDEDRLASGSLLVDDFQVHESVLRLDKGNGERKCAE